MTGRMKFWIAAASGGLLLVALGLHLGSLEPVRDLALVVAAVAAGAPTAVRAFQALRAKAFSIDLLVTIAVVGALIIGEYVEAAVVAFLFVFGAWLEARTLEKTRRSLRDLVDLSPQVAQVLRDGETVTVPAEDVVPGDRVLVHSGGTIAVDGTIVLGQAHVNQATITGEPLPVSRTVGEPVFSGTIVDSGYLEVVADRVGEETTFSRIIELVEEAQETKTKAQRFLDRFAGIYTPAIVVLAFLVFVLSRDVEFALTFLVIACPGALVISTPVSMVAGLGNGARHGVLMKGGDALERLAKADTFVFDKTGTLTQGMPKVTEIWTAAGDDDDRMLRLTAGLEVASEHPLGRTIVDEAKVRGLTLPASPHDVEVIKGGGIRGLVDGHVVAIGSRRVLATEGVLLPQDAATYAEERERAGNTAVFIAVDGALSGITSIADRIRPEAGAAIADLRSRGVSRFVMLTGDNAHTAQRVADELGIDEVRAELLPQDKVAAVSELKAEGRRVAMIGDGINDAPAIATADVGIAMGAGTDVSIDTADVILMANRFDQLVHALALARATVRNMKQNTVIALGTVVLLLAGVLAQQVFMSTGMLVHEVSVLVVILNAVRLVRFGAGKKDVVVARESSAEGTGIPARVGVE
ncbi:Cd2+/Zn2+-exporting ATPase [Cryobacterium mesophilum]|uniref:Cation-translocating P-type ATPase n=1 Tax=Terrimesophilobacter mesophilus TaxID=433647 RepID=A0A4R8VBN0_9MICO|nr:cation-translocating P-type ATPase [Terrimesophilobacter mesophilus]MBB5633505.1 Cd2+/Zn2+-exporting ATPase [Terrimesophilobacter mesophilus]TFB80213.1 cation-translocating P-type ATPase [Terrimesophilobacter mesophilus]